MAAFLDHYLERRSVQKFTKPQGSSAIDSQPGFNARESTCLPMVAFLAVALGSVVIGQNGFSAPSLRRRELRGDGDW